ncbi:inactive hydroxysteroid dehydrogenase-like protein 1 [Agrilus planipennis]|uniref:Inactive hydroxysteroid dehydrogenase-like protein 1 n=1 Tax=Agrilus planipennis TaxID=224129 RepID=A0A7F5RIU5_AGRPL|nr:inactive hydroxysteroid dehydrogenase-like protein 1 [Agrilus planipennis]
MYLGEVPDQELWDIININVGAVTMMTKMIIEEMKNKGRGAIVNVSSGAELQPLPLMNVYSASKVYVKSFTMALRHEYSKYGITVQHLSPLFLNTKMNQFSNRLQESGLFVPDAETYAKSAVNLLGRVDHTTGYWAHGIQYFFTTLAPVWIRIYVGGYMNRTFRKDYFRQNKNS